LKPKADKVFDSPGFIEWPSRQPSLLQNFSSAQEYSSLFARCLIFRNVKTAACFESDILQRCLCPARSLFIGQSDPFCLYLPNVETELHCPSRAPVRNHLQAKNLETVQWQPARAVYFEQSSLHMEES
jgi:hypothetical protein